MSTWICLAVLAALQQTPEAPAEPAPAPPVEAAAAPLYTPPAVRPFEMPSGYKPSTGEIPAAVEPPHSVKLDAYDRSYEGPKTSIEQMYERGVRGAFESAQVRLGRLDGQWSVVGPDGAPLITLLLNDPGAGVIDGAWRDLKGGPGLAGSGLLLSVVRDGDLLVIRYAPREDGPVCELRLHADAAGRFTGTLRTVAGAQRVVMARS